MTQFDMNILKAVSTVLVVVILALLFFIVVDFALAPFLNGLNALSLKLGLVSAAKQLKFFCNLSTGAVAFFDDLIEPFAFSLRGIFLPAAFFLTAFFATILTFCFSPKFLANALHFIREVGLDVFRGDRRAMVKFFIVFVAVFFAILVFNLTGLLTFNFTVTSTLLAPLLLSSAIFGVAVVNLVKNERASLFAGFLPSGADLFIAPFISLIEVMSFVAKYISLMVRLFANIFAGHLLLKTLYVALTAFVVSVNALSSLSVIIFIVFLLAIMLLETFIAFLQSLVFFVLSVMYYGESTDFTTAH